MTRRKLRLICGTVLLPASLTLLTWRWARQHRLNQALIQAVQRNDTATVTRLLTQGADANTQVMEVWAPTRWLWPSPAQLGLVQPESPLWQLWLARLHPRSDERAYYSPVLTVACDGNEQTVPTVRALLDAGADVNTIDTDNYRTALMMAAVHAAPETIRLLLLHGADIQTRNADGETALSCAAAVGNDRGVVMLLNRGADVNSQESNGNTPLMNAVLFAQNNTVRVLIQRHADLSLHNRDGKTALDMAQDLDTQGDPERQAAQRRIIRLLRRPEGTEP